MILSGERLPRLDSRRIPARGVISCVLRKTSVTGRRHACGAFRSGPAAHGLISGPRAPTGTALASS